MRAQLWSDERAVGETSRLREQDLGVEKKEGNVSCRCECTAKRAGAYTLEHVVCQVSEQRVGSWSSGSGETRGAVLGCVVSFLRLVLPQERGSCC